MNTEARNESSRIATTSWHRMAGAEYGVVAGPARQAFVHCSIAANHDGPDAGATGGVSPDPLGSGFVGWRTAGFSRCTAEGGRPAPALLFAPLFSGSHTGRLLSLGALMFAVGILTASLFLSGNDAVLDPDLLSRIEQGDIEALSALDQGSLHRMVIAFIIGISVSGTLSYMTIPLIWFHDRKLGAALADGLRALFANWKPFLVLGLGMAIVLVPVVLLAGISGQPGGKNRVAVHLPDGAGDDPPASFPVNFVWHAILCFL